MLFAGQLLPGEVVAQTLLVGELHALPLGEQPAHPGERGRARAALLSIAVCAIHNFFNLFVHLWVDQSLPNQINSGKPNQTLANRIKLYKTALFTLKYLLDLVTLQKSDNTPLPARPRLSHWTDPKPANQEKETCEKCVERRI